jgi:hypothetical protein
MAVFRHQIIKGQRIVLDENTIEHCILEDCELVYRGGDVSLNSELKRCKWRFEAQALNTIRVLRSIGLMPQNASTRPNA